MVVVPGVGAFDSFLWEYQSHTEPEVKRKSSILSILNESSFGDGLEDIQEEDEEENENKESEVKDEDDEEEWILDTDKKDFVQRDPMVLENEEEQEGSEVRESKSRDSVSKNSARQRSQLEEVVRVESTKETGNENSSLQTIDKTQNSEEVENKVTCFHTGNEDSDRNSFYPHFLKISLHSVGCKLSVNFLKGETCRFSGH